MKSRKPSIPYIIWMVIFTMIPIIMIGYTAFTDKNGNFSLEPFANAFFYTGVFMKSLWIALISTAICLVLAYPLAYIITKMKHSTQNTVIMLMMIPMWMNFLLRIYAWVTLLQDNGPIDMLLSMLGIHATYIGNTGAVVLGMVYEYLPFMVLPIYTVMSKIDGGLIEAAQDLGSNSFAVFRKVIFPLSIPGVISGITMVFVPSASTFLVSQYLGGTDDIMIGDIIDKIFWTDQNTGSAISLILMVFIFVFLILMNFFGDEEAIA
ncbi:ABC transporter permease [Ruminococcus sp.]|jgi:spermidine/putrescine transport system permease protein|uniref:ABC transporter permease n=1 Tax=Ruminococcus sp. TaxID=41978 RepID=UPI0025D0527F|nr:ABC transporter permease [Ruminococcus sp.]MCI2111968.1 ABC transporter permease [Ruminococcus sp.]MDD6989246.1 ABC transporter permease [Ruminococcus sp.]MDY6202101.1 ABC transporter permease [Ruminococcus sp.]